MLVSVHPGVLALVFDRLAAMLGCVRLVACPKLACGHRLQHRQEFLSHRKIQGRVNHQEYQNQSGHLVARFHVHDQPQKAWLGR